MSNNDVQQLRKDVKELMEAVTAVNERLQLWTQTDYEWKKQEVEKRQALETKIQPVVNFFEDWTRAKRVLLWVVGGVSAVLGFYLLAFEVFKTFIQK